MIPSNSETKVVTTKIAYLEVKLNALSNDSYEIFNIFFQSSNERNNDDRVTIVAYKTA